MKALVFGKIGKLPQDLSEKNKLILLRKRGLTEALCNILLNASILSHRGRSRI